MLASNDSTSAHSPAEPRQAQELLVCTQCNRSFGRGHHLRRHIKTHARERPFKCNVCGKAFSRVDTLHRHEITHKDPDRGVSAKGARACFACATARTKCTGDHPCDRCSRISSECEYPSAATATRGSSDSASLDGDQLSQRANPPERDILEETTNLHQPDPYLSPTAQETSSIGPSSAITEVHPASPGDIRPMAFLPTLAPEQQGIPSAQPMGVLNPSCGPSPAVSRQPLIIPENDRPSPVQIFSWATEGVNYLNWLPNDGPSQSEFPLELFPLGASTGNSWTGIPDGSSTRFPDIGSIFQNYVPSNLGSHASRALDEHSSSGNTDPRSAMSELHQSPLPESGHPNDVRMGSPRSASLYSPSAGQYYVDGDDCGRLPRIRRQKSPVWNSREGPLVDIPTLSRTANGAPLGFCPPEIFAEIVSAPPGRSGLPVSTYTSITTVFHDLCCESSIYFAAFENEYFLPYEVIDFAIYLYFQDFNSNLPIVHVPSTKMEECHWLLALSMASLGMHSMDFQGQERCVVAVHEFLRRAILAMFESLENGPNEIILVQAKVLNAIGLRYCGDHRLCGIAHRERADLAAYCKEQWPRSSANFELSFNTQDWKTWIRLETHRRIGYCIWLIDCMWALHTDSRPLLSLEDASIPLPCQEVLWDAESALVWQQLYEVATASPSLIAATQCLYIEKRLQWTVGEFSRTLLIHALFQRTWEVETYLNQPLSRWVPTAKREESKVQEDIWLPGIPLYSKWRNSACDSLDVLHWSANAVIGANSGIEHPTVMHLHLSRVILLTPFRAIRRLARSMTGEIAHKVGQSIAQDRQELRSWAIHDQFKARLAMIHAGVLFWHIRRYSANGFYEPNSVLLATLALWAYGTFSTQPRGEGSDVESTAPEPELSYPTSINLDRPADDELVQLFVRNGSHMKAFMMGVGDICGSRGPEKILAEGSKLLTTLLTWGCSRGHINFLKKLLACHAHERQQQRQQQQQQQQSQQQQQRHEGLGLINMTG